MIEIGADAGVAYEAALGRSLALPPLPPPLPPLELKALFVLPLLLIVPLAPLLPLVFTEILDPVCWPNAPPEPVGEAEKVGGEKNRLPVPVPAPGPIGIPIGEEEGNEWVFGNEFRGGKPPGGVKPGTIVREDGGDNTIGIICSWASFPVVNHK